ncbi:hypothetical protein GIB67_004611 [Kingdonia uniflora]|uniref:Magnesium transporter n=1 Tax=Kingdonia uniflora TaxID=39325 RepID=A0A7J7MD78_9MAGN|nr:hypothetical protein GIB67_004611 [Kingdonia uniflora]
MRSQQSVRRKGAGTRPWLVISDSGQSHFEEIGKQMIMQRTGLPARDLRILDPVLTYPSSILGRERAIVVNLEHIKTIITATEVLVLNSKDPLVAPFVSELERRVSSFSETRLNQTHGTNVYIPENRSNAARVSDSKVLPLEFKTLEVCLQCACRCLETETSTLVQAAYPALDELTTKISAFNLERVRNMKSRLVALSGRVQKIRDELENILDDDMDMAEMYLTDKLMHQQCEEIVSEDKIDDYNDIFDPDYKRDNDLKSTKSSSSDRTGLKPNVEELEMLLEVYFAEIEGTLSKLSTMREYVDDTEDYINIMLDDKQNQLLQMGVLLSTANLFLNMAIVVVAVFGMNITIDLFKSNHAEFMETTFGTIVGCIFLYILAVCFGKKRGLLE